MAESVAVASRPPRRIRGVLNLNDFEVLAQRHLPRPLFGYIAGASETGSSLRQNDAAFQRYGFVPRVLTDVSARSTETELLGTIYSAPFGIAPMGIAALMAYRGDIVMARAAQAAGIPMIMSGSSLIPLEDVARAVPGTWFQAYLPGETDKIDALLDRVAAAGFETLVLTVDCATLANRENNIRAGFSTPLRPSLRLAWDGLSHPAWSLGTLARTIVNYGIPHFENSYATRGAPVISPNILRERGKRDHLNWSHFARIRERWAGKLIIKGLLHEDDAASAVDHGTDGIIVSNHGGRQLDGTLAPLAALPAIVGRVGSKTTVMLDSGIRRGTDVIKALALGARFVFVGRPFLYAAAVGGEQGVTLAANILNTEIHRNMALLGVARTGDISSRLLTPI